MSREIVSIRVFLASPGGLEAERALVRTVTDEHNNYEAEPRNRRFTICGWETVERGVGRPQTLINRELDQCDYMILILADRWGSAPTVDGSFSSGTEEEYYRAIKAIKDADSPMKDVLVLFKGIPEGQMADAGPQLTQVIAFRKQLEDSKAIFFGTFESAEELQRLVRQHLGAWLRRSLDDSAGRPPLHAPIETGDSVDDNEIVGYRVAGDTGGVGRPPLADDLAKAEALADAGRLVEAEAIYSDLVVRTNQPEALLQFAFFLKRLGRLAHARRVLERLLLNPAVTHDSKLRARTLGTLAQVNSRLGDLEGSFRLHEDAKQLFAQVGDDEGVAIALANLGVVSGRLGRHSEAETLFREALALNTALGSRSRIASANNNLSILASRRNDLVAAEAFVRASLEVSRDLNDQLATATALVNLGVLQIRMKEPAQARISLEEARRINEKLGRLEGLASVASAMGPLHELEGHDHRAKEEYEAALRIAETVGLQELIAKSYDNLGRLANKEGNGTEAKRLWRFASRAYRLVGLIEDAQTLERACSHDDS